MSGTSNIIPLKCPAFIVNKTVQNIPLRSKSQPKNAFVIKRGSLVYSINQKYAEIVNGTSKTDRSNKENLLNSLKAVFAPPIHKSEIKAVVNKKHHNLIDESFKKLLGEDNLALGSLDTPDRYTESMINEKNKQENLLKEPAIIDKKVQSLIHRSISHSQLNDLHSDYKKAKIHHDYVNNRGKRSPSKEQEFSELFADNLIVKTLKKRQVSINSLLGISHNSNCFDEDLVFY